MQTDNLARKEGECEVCGRRDSRLVSGVGACCHGKVQELHPATEQGHPPTVMLTYSGRIMDLANADPAAVHWWDIAWSLASQRRYLGHGHGGGLSVAQHSVWVADYVEAVEGTTPEDVLHALLHDAHEAYMGDIIRPLKALPGMREPLEQAAQQIQAAIECAFHLDPPSLTARALITEADHQATIMEMRHLWPLGEGEQLLPAPDATASGLGPMPPMNEEAARERFIHALRYLTSAAGMNMPEGLPTKTKGAKHYD